MINAKIIKNEKLITIVKNASKLIIYDNKKSNYTFDFI